MVTGSGQSNKQGQQGSNSLIAPLANYSNFILAFGMVAVLGTLIVPLPTPVLDMLLACSISLAIAVLIVTLSSKEALELSTFPSLPCP